MIRGDRAEEGMGKNEKGGCTRQRSRRGTVEDMGENERWMNGRMEPKRRTDVYLTALAERTRTLP